jgi:hypothetical protein
MYRKFLSTVASIFFCLLIAPSADATTYRYLDANGTTCYTDDLSSVPPRFQSRVVIVVDKQGKGKKQDRPKAAPVQTVSEDKSGESVAPSTSFRLNWLFLSCLLVTGFFVAHRVQKSGRIERAFRIRTVSVFLVFCLAVVFNQDITDKITGAVRDKYSGMQAEMKAQEERDKKPLKTLSEKMDEMIHEAQK